jgi:cold shock CspA family protein
VRDLKTYRNMAPRLSGKLIGWNDDRGFGFIAPRDGGRELFVHISSFPRDGSRPTVGETLVYELGRGKDGKPQAVKVHRQALGNPSAYPRRQPQSHRRTRSPANALIGVALLVALGAFGYAKYNQHVAQLKPAAAAPFQETTGFDALSGSYRCDGRTYCSQMTSCSEAKFFLKNCPGTQMDGNHDGVPCEQQWCTSPFSK